MVKILNEQDIVDVLWGATLMGGGGGGSLQNGLDLIANLKENYSNLPIQVELITVDEMSDEEYACVTCGMGAPSAIKKLDFGPYAKNAFDALKDMASKMDDRKNIKYSFGVELGGFNTFVPMYISILSGTPFIDADGCGRAVPALNTLLLHINGCDTSPLAMANGVNDRVEIKMSNPKNAVLAEEIGRHICITFNMLAGLAGWMLSKQEIKEKIVTGSITKCMKIGKIMRECTRSGKAEAIFDELNKSGIASKLYGIGEVIKSETKQEGGFDFGEVTVQTNKIHKIYFQNENLLISEITDTKEKALMTVPDIICMYDAKEGTPLTNADIKEGMQIGIGAIKVDDKWWKNKDMFTNWQTFLDRVGYTGENIPFKV